MNTQQLIDDFRRPLSKIPVYITVGSTSIYNLDVGEDHKNEENEEFDNEIKECLKNLKYPYPYDVQFIDADSSKTYFYVGRLDLVFTHVYYMVANKETTNLHFNEKMKLYENLEDLRTRLEALLKMMREAQE